MRGSRSTQINLPDCLYTPWLICTPTIHVWYIYLHLGDFYGMDAISLKSFEKNHEIPENTTKLTSIVFIGCLNRDRPLTPIFWGEQSEILPDVGDARGCLVSHDKLHDLVENRVIVIAHYENSCETE